MGQAGQARHGISTAPSLLFFTMCIDNTVPLTDRPWQLVSPCYHWKLKEAQEKHENFDWSHSLRKRLFVLRFYGQVHPMGSCRAWSVYLTTLLLGRLRPSSSYTVLCTFFRQKRVFKDYANSNNLQAYSLIRLCYTSSNLIPNNSVSRWS